jgi:hypothetical protein
MADPAALEPPFFRGIGGLLSGFIFVQFLTVAEGKEVTERSVPEERRVRARSGGVKRTPRARRSEERSSDEGQGTKFRRSSDERVFNCVESEVLSGGRT